MVVGEQAVQVAAAYAAIHGHCALGCCGGYLHGLFGNDQYRASLIRSLGGKSSGESHLAKVEQALDELAGDMERYLDVDGLLGLAGV